MRINLGGWWTGSRDTLSFTGCLGFGFGGPNTGTRSGDVPECGSGAVRLVAAEHLCGERWVVGEPFVRECFVESLERTRTEGSRGLQCELGVLFTPDDVIGCRLCGLGQRESPHVVAWMLDVVKYSFGPVGCRCGDL